MKLSNYPRWRRPLVVMIIVPLMVVASTTALYYGNLHRLSAVDRITDLGSINVAEQSRVLVFAPHCDDETLGVGGLMKTLKDAKTPVRTVFFTNGDGFRIAAQFHLKKLNLDPADYLAFGEARQKEALASATLLGQSASDVRFLGYPDQGLLAMLVAPGQNPEAFRPTTTKSASVPYIRSAASGLSHVRESVVSSVQQQLADFKPTDVYVTHPLDDHSDHAASPVYVQLAIDRGVKNGDFPRPRVHWYLIHRGDWPLPQGDHPERWLVPPPAIAECGNQWQSLSLSQNVFQAKRAALHAYSSQINVMKRMLLSLLRKNEIVTSGDAPAIVNQGSIEPVGDNVARFANPSADIARLNAEIVGPNLVVRTTMAGPCSPAIDAFLTVVTSDDKRSNAYRIKLPRPQLLETQQEIATTIALSKLRIDASTVTVAIGVSTYAAEGLLIDRSAFHFVKLPSTSVQNAGHSDAKSR